MVTVRDLKAKIGLNAGEYIKGMKTAASKTRSFKNFLVKAATGVKDLEVAINSSNMDLSKIPSSIKITSSKKALIDSLKSHLKGINTPPLRTVKLAASKTTLKDSVTNWVKGIKRLPLLPFRINETTLKKSITKAITNMKKSGGAFFRKKDNMLPLQAAGSTTSGKGSAVTPTGANKTLDDVNDTLERILGAIGTDAKSLKEHVDDSGTSGGMETFGGGGGFM